MSRLLRKCSSPECQNNVWARDMCRKHYMRWWVHGDAGTVLLKMAEAGAPAAFIDALPEKGDGCVTWPFAKNNSGYAQINIGSGKKKLVSRIVCERTNGPAPSDAHVAAHDCGKGHEACVAPWHIRWKTKVENSADMEMHETLIHSDNAPWSKLSTSDVRAIRELAGTMSQSKIGERYGVSQSAISLIIRGVNWRRAR